MWCIKTMGKETTRLLFNKLTTVRPVAFSELEILALVKGREKGFGNIA